MFPLLHVCLSGEKSASVISDIYSCDGSRKGESHIRAAGNSKASGNWSFVFINCFSQWRRSRLIKLTSPRAWRTNVWWLMLLSSSKSYLPLKFIVKAMQWLVKKVMPVQKNKSGWLDFSRRLIGWQSLQISSNHGKDWLKMSHGSQGPVAVVAGVPGVFWESCGLTCNPDVSQHV